MTDSHERRSRAATVHLVGGRPSLDLANTVSFRPDPDRREEHLLGPADALTWCLRAGVLDQSEVDQLETELHDRPRRARAMVTALMDTRELIWNHVVDPDSLQLSGLTSAITAALAHCTLREHEGRAQWEVTIFDEHAPARRILVDLLDLLSNPPGRIGRCDGDDCGWAFVDTSRGRNRRWCSSADCGNRHRVRQHHARQHQNAQ